MKSDKNRNDADESTIQEIRRLKNELGKAFPRYAVFIVAFNNADDVVSVLKRIPEAIYDLLEEVYVFDDFSQDDTFITTRRYVADALLQKISVYQNPRKYGYGGNQKLGYEYALAKKYDHVILLQGDGKYAPECLPDFILATLKNDAHIVIGSRFVPDGREAFRKMPLLKYIAIRLLNAYQNFLLRGKLSDYHCGYRLYSTSFLKKAQFNLNTNDYHFDTEIILQAHSVGERIRETPVPVYSSKEISRIRGFEYAFHVMLSVLDYRLHRIGITSKRKYTPILPVIYTLKDFPYSSHQFILQNVKPGQRVLDIGCGDGSLAHRIRQKGCHVTGIDLLSGEDLNYTLDHYITWNLEEPRDLPLRREFDCVILGDIIEHLVDGIGLLMRVRKVLKENGRLIISTPNIALWYYRLMVGFGRFTYKDKGIMDQTHVHFYTLQSLRDHLKSTGYNLLAENVTGIPFPLVIKSPRLKWLAMTLNAAYYRLARLWPKMFAYQFVITAEIVRLEWDEMIKLPARYRDPHPHLHQPAPSA